MHPHLRPKHIPFSYVLDLPRVEPLECRILHGLSRLKQVVHAEQVLRIGDTVDA